MLFYLSSAVLVAALLLGGGTHVGFLGDVALQFLAIPLLCMALWPAFSQQSLHRKKARLALRISAASPPWLRPFNFLRYLDYCVRRYGFTARKLRRLACGARSSHPYPHTRGRLGRGTISDSSPFDFCRQRSAYSRTAHSPLLSIGRAGSCVASYRLSADGPRVREQPAFLRVHEPN